MTNRISKLVLAAVLLSSIPLAASAHDRDGDRDRAPYAGYAQPGTYPAPPPTPRDWRDARESREWRGRDWRDARESRDWREHERAELRAQLRALDAERDAFYAANAWRPGRTRRYERSYAVRRAELERRLSELQPVAWR